MRGKGGLSAGGGKERNCGSGYLLWFLQVGTGEAGQADLVLASLNNFSGFWGIGAIPGCQVPSFGVQ